MIETLTPFLFHQYLVNCSDNSVLIRGGRKNGVGL